jgi:hypothetical protein
MNLRVLLGAVVAALILVGSAAQADLAPASGEVQTLEATAVPAWNASGPEGVPAASGEHSPSQDADSDSDQDPVVKVRQSGLLVITGPIRQSAARRNVQCLSARPPAPPPRLGGAAKYIATQIASVGAESAGSEFSPQNIAAIHGARAFLSSTSASLSVAKAQTRTGDEAPSRHRARLCGFAEALRWLCAPLLETRFC